MMWNGNRQKSNYQYETFGNGRFPDWNVCHIHSCDFAWNICMFNSLFLQYMGLLWLSSYNKIHLDIQLNYDKFYFHNVSWFISGLSLIDNAISVSRSLMSLALKAIESIVCVIIILCGTFNWCHQGYRWWMNYLYLEIHKNHL